jgi:hypothetical protein
MVANQATPVSIANIAIGKKSDEYIKGPIRTKTLHSGVFEPPKLPSAPEPKTAPDALKICCRSFRSCKNTSKQCSNGEMIRYASLLEIHERVDEQIGQVAKSPTV